MSFGGSSSSTCPSHAPQVLSTATCFLHASHSASFGFEPMTTTRDTGGSVVGSMGASSPHPPRTQMEHRSPHLPSGSLGLHSSTLSSVEPVLRAPFSLFTPGQRSPHSSLRSENMLEVLDAKGQNLQNILQGSARCLGGAPVPSSRHSMSGY